MWNLRCLDVECLGNGMFRMRDVQDVGCFGFGMLGIWDVGDVEWFGCGMLVIWDALDMNIWDVACLDVKVFGCEMFKMRDICLDEGC